MPTKTVFLVDGWFMNRAFHGANHALKDGNQIVKYCRLHLAKDDILYRIYFYDTNPYLGDAIHPVDGNRVDFSSTYVAKKQGDLLNSLKKTPYVDVRLGRTVFDQQWIIKPELTQGILNGSILPKEIVSNEVKPLIRQKGVDMMLGLDLACLVLKRLVDKVVVISADSDMAPATQFAKDEGIQVVLDPCDTRVGIHLESAVDAVASVFNDYLHSVNNVRIIKRA